MLQYISLKFWLKKLKQDTTYVSVAMSQFSCKFFDTLFVFAFLSVCSLPPLVQDCWEFETVTNWGRREKDKYAFLLSSTCWSLLVTVLVCLVFLYSVFWIWNCDKLRLVREGRRTGMPFPCQWNVTEERHNSSLILCMSPGCFICIYWKVKGDYRTQTCHKGIIAF